MSAAGFTLVEVVVVLAVIAVIATVTSVALVPAVQSGPEGWQAELSRARAEAIRSGHQLVVRIDSVPNRVLLLTPDGAVIGEGIDRFTGRPVPGDVDD